ncbi:TetR/AcrR family transcriptional regulator [Marinobacteraceae bacterium S3BR75-40.1]
MSLDPRRTEQIFHAAADVFCQQGYARASMDRIAREAGVSKATLYNHFDSKSTLFRAVVRQASEAFVLELDELALASLPLEDALQTLGHYYLDFLLQERNLAVVRAVLAESQLDPDLGRAFHESGPAVAQQAVADLFARRMASGELPSGDSAAAARYFVALLRGDLFWRGLLQVPVSQTERRSHLAGAVRQFLYGCGSADD